MLDGRTDEPVIPHGSIGFRHNESGMGKWNLDLDGIEPVLSLYDDADESVAVDLPRFDVGDAGSEQGSIIRRGVPVRRIGDRLVTTVYDLLLAQYGVGRDGLPGEWAGGYDDASSLYTPAWQEEITSVPAETVTRIAREFAANAEESGGRSMITLGAGTNHWYHSDTTYRAIIALVMLTGCQGKNGGGWAHYVGQEKARPVHRLGAAGLRARLGAPAAADGGHVVLVPAHRPVALRRVRRRGRRDPARAPAASPASRSPTPSRRRCGWAGRPGSPTFDRNPLTLAADAEKAGMSPADYVVVRAQGRSAQVRGRGPGRAGELPAGAHRVAGQPARLVGQGQRVLPAPPARRRRRHRQRGDARGPAPQGRDVAREGARRQARPAGLARLPDDQHRPVQRRAAAGGDVVREVRHRLHRHAPVHPRVQRRDRTAVAGAQRLRHVHPPRRGLQRDGRAAPRHPDRRRRDAAHPRHPDRDRSARRSGARLACGGVRADPRQDDAEPRGRGARLRRRSRR